MLCLGEVLCSTELHQFLGCLLVAEILKCQTAASAKGSMFDDCKEGGGISAPSALRGCFQRMLHTQQELYAAYVDCCPFPSPFVDSLGMDLSS